MYSCQQVGNIFFLDKFLGHSFWNYGTKVLQFSSTDQENRTDPMIAVFPRLTKCLFHTYGPSGMYIFSMILVSIILISLSFICTNSLFKQKSTFRKEPLKCQLKRMIQWVISMHPLYLVPPSCEKTDQNQLTKLLFF